MVRKNDPGPYREQDLQAMHVSQLRVLARKDKIASAHEIVFARKQTLISWLLKRPEEEKIYSSKESILDSIPDKDVNAEIIHLFRRMVMLISDESYKRLLTKLSENK